MQPREPRRMDRPEPGYWAMRLRRGCPEVPAAIIRLHTIVDPYDPFNIMDRSPFLAGFLNGEVVPVSDVWERLGRVITETEYRKMPIIENPYQVAILSLEPLPF